MAALGRDLDHVRSRAEVRDRVLRYLGVLGIDSRDLDPERLEQLIEIERLEGQAALPTARGRTGRRV
jgi:hypothetical protein